MHQIRAVSLKAYLDVAHYVGIDGLMLLAEAGIARSDLDDDEMRLPAETAVQLLERSAQASGCQHFGILMAQCRSFASLGAVGLLLQHLATIDEVITSMMSFRRSLSDVLFVALEKNDDVAMITFDLIPPYSRPLAADLAIGLGMMTLRAASGGRWSPEAIHFAHKRPDNIEPFEAFFRAPLEFDSVFNGFSCSRRSLDVALPLADSAMARNAIRLLGHQHLPREDAPLSDHVRQSIVLLLRDGKATLEGVASNVGLTPRSLQRRLETEGRTFAELLNEARRELARHYLANSRLAITEIAESLGYAAPTSFARWYFAEFGMSPRASRAKLISSADLPPLL